MEDNRNSWHGAHHYSDKLHLSLVLFLIFGIVLLVFSYFFINGNNFKSARGNNPPLTPIPTPTPQQNDEVFCTQDAKLCPDGSYVGRVGPSCELAPCHERNG